MSSDIMNFFGVMMTIVTAALLAYGGFTLIKALNRRMGGDRAPPVLSRDELEVMRAQLADVDSLRDRLGELEERLDFAERVLAQRGEAGQLPGRGQ